MAATPMLWDKASCLFERFRKSGMDRRRAIARRGLAYVMGWIAKCKLFNANCKVFRSDMISTVGDCQFAMSILQIAIAP
jgi:hypothetical protein